MAFRKKPEEVSTDEFIRLWLEGSSVWVIDSALGQDIGPTYHLCIHLAWIYAVVAIHKTKRPFSILRTAIIEQINVANKHMGLALSMNQTDQAKTIAFGVLTEGAGKWFAPPTRCTLISNRLGWKNPT